MARQRLFTDNDLQLILRKRAAARKKASPPPNIPMNGTTEDFSHPASYEDPEMDAYAMGDTSSWAEDVHPGPYRQSPPPAIPMIGTTEDPSHPAYEPKVEVPSTGPRTVSEADAYVKKAATDRKVLAHIYRKSDLCTKIAVAAYPGRNAGFVEQKSMELMDETPEALARMASFLNVAEEEEDEEEKAPEKAAFKQLNSRLARIDKNMSRLARKIASEDEDDDAVEAFFSGTKDLMSNQNNPNYPVDKSSDYFDPMGDSGDFDSFESMEDSYDSSGPMFEDDVDDDFGMPDMGIPSMGMPDMDDDDLMSQLMAMDEDDGEEEKESSLQEVYRTLLAMDRSDRSKGRRRRAADELPDFIKDKMDKKDEDKKEASGRDLYRILMAMDEDEGKEDKDEEKKEASRRQAARILRKLAADEESEEEDEVEASDDEDTEDDDEADKEASRRASRQVAKILRKLAAEEDAEEEDEIEASDEDEDEDEVDAAEEEEDEEDAQIEASLKALQARKQARARLRKAAEEAESEDEEDDGKSAYGTYDMTVDKLYTGPGVQSGAGGNKNPPGAANTPQVSKGARKKMVVTGSLDPMGTWDGKSVQAGQDMYGIHSDPLAGLLSQRYAGEEEEVEEEGEVEEVEAKKKANRKTAKQRPQLPKTKTASVAMRNKTAQAEIAELSKLWDAPPDISGLWNPKGW